MQCNYTTISVSFEDHYKLVNGDLYMLRWDFKTFTEKEIEVEFNSLGSDEKTEYCGFKDYLRENYITFAEWCKYGNKTINII